MSDVKNIRDERYDWERARGEIIAFGQSKTLTAWTKDARCVVKREVLRTRLALGWEPEDAITRAKHERPSLEFTHNGRTMTLRGWAEQSGINYHTLYNRINASLMTFADALAKGPDGSDFAIAVTAFGETKPIYQWGVDHRANCTATTIRRRIRAGWSPQEAITEEPDFRGSLGTGVPCDAFGRRMGLEDWARLTQIPAVAIKQRMDGHDLTLEAALRSFGWVPNSKQDEDPDLLRVRAEELRPGDTILAVSHDADPNDACFSVRRIELATWGRARRG